MSVLDELRAAMRKALEPRCVHTYVDQQMQFQAMRAAQVIDAFEAAHPGLVDTTPHCDFCGKPLPADENGYVDWNNTPVLAHDDGSPMYGCPTCAKEATE